MTQKKVKELKIGDIVTIDGNHTYQITAIRSCPERNPEKPLFFDMRAVGEKTTSELYSEYLCFAAANPYNETVQQCLKNKTYLTLNDVEGAWFENRNAQKVVDR